ncbi:hypothetical protein CDV36_008621 [Fusarium kuroshium]|uniref:Uncharacterized protein n=1 Tax=Fusarium kuroshium TaxID=2010991 RepID=A0A3M2S2E9_9HYPO|nr:hypothetical protein CDV36_008621 [Fusarium kuroshium]
MRHFSVRIKRSSGFLPGRDNHPSMRILLPLVNSSLTVRAQPNRVQGTCLLHSSVWHFQVSSVIVLLVQDPSSLH